MLQNTSQLLPGASNATTSTTGLLQGGQLKPDENFLVLGENIGVETRNSEFKQGGGAYLKKTLKDHVSKYVCSFLNSEGGSLWIGIDDNGTVQGVTLNQREEDTTRLCIDSVIRTIRPLVFPQNYQVSFIKVVQKIDDRNQIIENTRVLKISVAGTDHSRLYETARGDAYIRRDGSTQGPMRALEIVEFTNMLHDKEMKEKNEEIARLCKTVNNLTKKDQKLENLMGFRKNRNNETSVNTSKMSSYETIDSKCTVDTVNSNNIWKLSSKNSIYSRICTIL